MGDIGRGFYAVNTLILVGLVGLAADTPPMGVGVSSAVLGGEWPRDELARQGAWACFRTEAHGGAAVIHLAAGDSGDVQP